MSVIALLQGLWQSALFGKRSLPVWSALYSTLNDCTLSSSLASCKKAQYHQDQLNLYGGLQLSHFKLLRTSNSNNPHPDLELSHLTRYISDDDRYLVSSLLFCSSLFSPGRQETGFWPTGDTPNSG